MKKTAINKIILFSMIVCFASNLGCQKISQMLSDDKQTDTSYEIAKLEAEKAKLEAEKAKLEAEKAKQDVEKLKLEAEKAKQEAETAPTPTQDLAAAPTQPQVEAPAPTQAPSIAANSQWPNMSLTFAQNEAQAYASQATTFLNTWISTWNSHDVIRLGNIIDDTAIYLLGKIYSKDDYQTEMQRRFSKHPQARQTPDGNVFVNFIKTDTTNYLSFEFSEMFTNDGNKESSANKMLIAAITPNGLRMVHESDEATDFNVEVKSKLVPNKSINSCKDLIYKIITTSPAYHVDWMSKPESQNGVETNDFTDNGNRTYSLSIETPSSDGPYSNEFSYDVDLNNRSLHFTGGFNDLDVTVKIAPRWDSDLRRLCP